MLVTGKWVNTDGSGASGYAVFTSFAPTQGGKMVYPQSGVDQVLDDSGAISVDLNNLLVPYEWEVVVLIKILDPNGALTFQRYSNTGSISTSGEIA